MVQIIPDPFGPKSDQNTRNHFGATPRKTLINKPMISPIPFFLLNNKKRKQKEVKPAIDTLSAYTQLPSEEFLKLLAKKLKSCGINETLSYITSWYGFDSLTHKQKADFVRRVETPEYYTLKARVERIFNKARKWKK